MDSIYWIIITALLLLAAFDLINGVANDAVNFLNSAIGSKAAPVRVILTVASIGVLVGACFSGGMMEVARNGIFHPDMFSYHEVMLLFLGVMISEVILLDTFNTFGLPTSTTVSLVFGILGSAVATALFKISKLRLVQSVWDFINTDKAFEIVTSILLSVAIAFTVGTIVMWISRLAFTFKYQSRFKWFGCFWCGIAMTAIAYFAVFKGLKESTLMEPSFIQYIDQNLGMALFFRAHVPASAFVHDEYSAPDRSGGHFFPGSGLCGQRPGEFHRRFHGWSGFLPVRQRRGGGRWLSRIHHLHGVSDAGAGHAGKPLYFVRRGLHDDFCLVVLQKGKNGDRHRRGTFQAG